MKNRGDPEVFHRGKDMYYIYTIQIVMQLPYKRGFKHGFLSITCQLLTPKHSKHNQNILKYMSIVSLIRKVDLNLVFTKLLSIVTFDILLNS